MRGDETEIQHPRLPLGILTLLIASLFQPITGLIGNQLIIAVIVRLARTNFIEHLSDTFVR